MADISDSELEAQLGALEVNAPKPVQVAPEPQPTQGAGAPAIPDDFEAQLQALEKQQQPQPQLTTLAPLPISGTNRNNPASTGPVTSSRAPMDRPEVLAALGAEPGQGQGAVPFDPKQGAGWLTRLASQFTFNKAQAEYVLKRDPAVQEVRYNSLGDPVLRIKDKDTGEVKDILANPVGLDWGDSAFLVANAPLLVGGMLAGAGKTALELRNASSVVKALMNKGVLATAGRVAVGGRAAQGAVEAVGERALLPSDGAAKPETASEMATRQGEGALTDFLFGSMAGGVGKGLSRVITPTTSRGPIQVEAANAEALVKAAYLKSGLPYYQEITPGEATGSEILQRTEAYEAVKPGSSGPFKEYVANKVANDASTKQILLGADPSAVPPADLVGQNVIASVKNELRPIDEILDRTSQEALDSVNAEIKKGVASTTGIPQNLEDAAVGKGIFTGAERLHEAFRANDAKLYSVVRENPLVAGQGRNIDATPLALDAQALLDQAASVEKRVEVPSVDSYGSPIARSETRTEPITSVLNPNTTSILKQLAAARGGKLGLSDLIEARTDIGDAMSSGSVLGGVGERRLGGIYSALTQRIQTGLDELDPTGGLKKAWEAANAHHAENIGKFQATSILPMFKEAEQQGALTVYDVVNRAINNPGKWVAYRDFFGAGSSEMASLRRVFADRLIGRVVGSETVDFGAFLQRLQGAYETKGDIVADVFKGSETKLKNLALAGEALQKGGSVDAQSLAENLEKGTLTRRKLEQLAIEQQQKSNAFSNDLLAGIVSGKFDATPSQLVDHLVFNPQVQPDQLRKVVSYLADDPQALHELQQRTLLKMFNEASAGPKSTQQFLQSNLLRKFLTNGDTDLVRDRLDAVLGGETMQLLDAVHGLRRPGEMKAEMFARAGQLATASQIANIERNLFGKGMVGEIGGILKSWLVSSLYLSGPTRAYISNTALSDANKAAFAQGLVLMTPSVRSLTTLFGGEASRQAAIQLKAAIDSDLREEQKKGAVKMGK